MDVPEAIEWWQRAAQSGYSDAEFAIGMAYLNGETRTLKKDLGRALEWLARAGGHGNPDAREIVERLVLSETEKVLVLRPQVLSQPWLGTPVQVRADTAAIVGKPSTTAKTLYGRGSSSRSDPSSGACWSCPMARDLAGSRPALSSRPQSLEPAVLW